MTRIHPTAVIGAEAELADDVRVGPYCVIDGPARLGAGCELQSHVTIVGDTTVGAGNRFFPGAVIGTPPQDLKHRGEHVRLVIGDGNQFREHVTVHAGTAVDRGVTVVGSNSLFMVGSHVAHDCLVGDNVILANNVLLAGHITVSDRAILNGASACHHFTSIGRMAYVGGLTRITQDVHPFTIVEGHPARVRACNVIGLQRAGIPAEDVEIVRRAVREILVSDRLTTAEAIEQVEARHPDHALVAELIASVRAAAAGRQGRAQEPQR
jgi:UDP-N-acetylglucosamine acyltransferase